MKTPKSTKQRYQQYSKAGRRYNDEFNITPGMRGFLVTCDRGRERAVVREMIDVLQHMTHVEEEEVEEELSIEASIQQEVQGLKANTKAKFVGKNTKIDCSTPSQYHLTRVVVFVQALDASLDVVKTAHELVSNATYSKKTRFTQRIVPFHATCYGNPTDILNMMTTMVQATFNDTLNKDTSFAIVARVRNNDKVIKDDVVAQVAELAKGYRVDLKNPDKVILIEVFKSICGASIVDDYYTLKKYNAQAM